MLYLWFTLAQAGGFYHPMDIANESQRFTSASDALQVPVANALASAEARAAALIEHELALDLLGARVVPEEREHHLALRAEYQREFQTLQEFTDRFVADFDTAFTSAMGRVLSAQQELTECVREIEQGPSLPGLPSRWVPNPECSGTDENTGLARRIDADPQLDRELKELLARTWPELSPADGPGAALESAPNWVDLSRVAQTLLDDMVKRTARDEASEQSRLEIEQSDTSSPTYVAALQTLRERTAKLRRESAAQMMEAVERAFRSDTKRGAARASWCPRPASLGGCVGEDVTDAWLARIQSDRKIQKALN